ncbi:probable O-methyltransferase 3 [Benincasa hispida]|uniref:probable O-methyltransferase 3 n=1 Tax=Benincasa hispida TaxID=102211 RepID=UPI0019028F3C|nr:probable O-methyltransferase 3 [Benincasa hispida]
MEDELFLEAQAHIWNHTLKYINSMSLKCVVELGIPDIIHNHGQPMSLSQLVEALHIHPSKSQPLARLMRLLVHSGFFSQTQQQLVTKYGLTPSSRLLLRRNTTTTTTIETLPFLVLILHQAMMAPWESMSSWLRSEEYGSAFEMVNGKSVWKYIGDEPDFGSLFYQTLVYDSQLIGKLVKRPECREVFDGVKSMVDVGGGEGIVAKAIEEAFPHINCIVLDLPYQTTKDLNVIGGGNLFEPIQIPPTDAVLLVSVLHKYNDEEIIRILKNCKDAITNSNEGGKVIIIEAVLEKEKQMEHKESIETELCGDVLMMATFNTTKRNEKEWKTLFLAAGFSHHKITSFLGLRSLIQLYP